MAEVRQVETGKIGVVTVTYNSEPVLQEFFTSLAAQTHRNFILYVVDNASKDRTLEITRRQTDMSPVIIANTENLGVAEGNNQGIRAALVDGCECVLLLNNDTVFPADLIGQLYAGLEEHKCDMTTGKMYYHDKPDIFWCAGGHFQPWLGFSTRHDGEYQKDTGQFDEPRRITYTPTCCLMLRRSVFDRIGLMDGRYFAYSDDVDFLYRCLKSNATLWYVPEARLWHKVSSLSGKMSDTSLHYSARNRIYFIRKHLPYPIALFWYMYSLIRSRLSALFGISSFQQSGQRQISKKEGWKMLSR